MRSIVRRIRATPIRFRIVYGAFILGSLLVILVVQTTVQPSEDALRDLFDDRNEALLDIVASRSREPLSTGEYSQFTDLLRELNNEELVRTIDLVDVSGQIVSSSDQSRIGLDSASSAVLRGAGDDQHPVVERAIITESGKIGTVRAVLDQSSIDAVLATQRRRGVTTGLLGVALVAFLSLIAGWAATRRISDLESQLGSVDEHGLPGLVRTTGNDEIARLGDALNHRTMQTREVLRAHERSRKKLLMSETKLHLAVSVAADAVFEMDLVDGELKIVDATTTGRIARDLVTTDVQELQDGIHPDDRGLILQAALRAISGSAAANEVDEIEIRFDTKQFGWRDLLVRLQLVGTATGSPARLLIAIVDVTEQRLTARHLARSDKMRTIGQLTAGIAHDFNNALAVSRLQLSVLKHSGRDRARDDERIGQLILANNNASELVQRLLLSASPQSASPTHHKVADFIQSLDAMLRTMLGPDVVLTLALMAQDDDIEIDQAATQQVFLNLAKNAVDAMQGSGEVTIRTFNPSDKAVAIEVSDTGPGIDPAIADTLFDPFVTTKPLGAGTGLGLATAFQTVTAAGGTITTSSNPGGGTSFTVTLPLVPMALEPDDEPADDIANHEADLTGSKRILLVDDNTALLDGLTELLADNGYDVSPATCSDDAMQLVSESDGFDLIFTDIALSDGSGFDLRAEVALLNPDIRTVYMSAILPSDAVFRFNGGTFLQKPFDDAAVLAMVASVFLSARPVL